MLVQFPINEAHHAIVDAEQIRINRLVLNIFLVVLAEYLYCFKIIKVLLVFLNRLLVVNYFVDHVMRCSIVVQFVHICVDQLVLVE